MNKSIKLSVFCVIIGLISIQTFAETKEEVKFGLKGGINVSTTLVSLPIPEYYTQYDTEYKYNAGFNAGMFVEFPITMTLSFLPELTLSVKGMRNESFILQGDWKCIAHPNKPTKTEYADKTGQMQDKTL